MTLGSMRSQVLTGPEVKEKLAPRKEDGVEEVAGASASTDVFIAVSISAVFSDWLPLRLGGPVE